MQEATSLLDNTPNNYLALCSISAWFRTITTLWHLSLTDLKKLPLFPRLIFFLMYKR